MRVSADKMAVTILSQTTIDPEHITARAIDALAICVGYGNGACRINEDGTALLVLCDIVSCDDNLCPHVVQTTPPATWAGSARYGPRQLAEKFRCEIRNDIGNRSQGLYPNGYNDAWLPVPLGVTDHIPFRGPGSVKPVANTVAAVTIDREIDWYNLSDLTDFPVGCILWRLLETGALVVYQRLQPNLIVATPPVKQPYPAVNIVALVDKLRATEFTATEGPRPLLYAV